MAKNNYQYEKRQKEIARKKKKDEKRQKKLEIKEKRGEETHDAAPEDDADTED